MKDLVELVKSLWPEWTFRDINTDTWIVFSTKCASKGTCTASLACHHRYNTFWSPETNLKLHGEASHW